MHRITTNPAAVTIASLAGALLLIAANQFAIEDGRRYGACLAQQQSPAYCRLAISGR